MNPKTEMPWPKRMRRLLARETTLRARQRRIADQLTAVHREMKRLIDERGAAK